MTKKDQYSYGREKERRLAQLLRNKGASVQLSKASRGAGDLVARFSTGRKWLVEVKASRTGRAASLNRDQRTRLNRAADRMSATPVVASVTRRGVEYRSTRSDRRLSPLPRGRRG